MSCDANFIKTHCNYKNDYECQRKCNILKLKGLYTKELDNYYKTYQTYLNLKYSRGSGSSRGYWRAVAESKWRPKVVAINRRLNKILDDLKNNIEHTQSLIDTQEKEIQKKNDVIYKRNRKISKLNSEITEKSDEFVSKEQQIESGIERNNFKRNSMYILIALIVLVAGILAYLLTKKN